MGCQEEDIPIKKRLETSFLLEFYGVGDSVFSLFPFFCRLFVVFPVPIFLHNTLHNGFFAKAGNQLVVAFSFILFDYKHLNLCVPSLLLAYFTKFSQRFKQEDFVEAEETEGEGNWKPLPLAQVLGLAGLFWAEDFVFCLGKSALRLLPVPE